MCVCVCVCVYTYIYTYTYIYIHMCIYIYVYVYIWASVVKNLPANAGDIRDSGSIPGSGGFPWRQAWQHTPVFLSGESHGQRNLAGYSP